MTSVCLILWFLECREAGPYFCPPVLRLVDFHGICCQAACPALGQRSTDEGVRQPFCSWPGFKQALKTRKESGLQFSYLKNMFASLVHKQGKFLATEKVVPVKDFLEWEVCAFPLTLASCVAPATCPHVHFPRPRLVPDIVIGNVKVR